MDSDRFTDLVYELKRLFPNGKRLHENLTLTVDVLAVAERDTFHDTIGAYRKLFRAYLATGKASERKVCVSFYVCQAQLVVYGFENIVILQVNYGTSAAGNVPPHNTDKPRDYQSSRQRNPDGFRCFGCAATVSSLCQIMPKFLFK